MDQYLNILYLCSNLVSSGETSNAKETTNTSNDRHRDHSINQEDSERWEQSLSLVNFLGDLAGEVGQLEPAHPFLLVCRLSTACCR